MKRMVKSVCRRRAQALLRKGAARQALKWFHAAEDEEGAGDALLALNDLHGALSRYDAAGGDRKSVV